MKSYRLFIAFGVSLLVSFAANATEYQNRGSDASDQLFCRTISAAKIQLSASGKRDWGNLCKEANRVHAQLLSGNCKKMQGISPECRAGIEADDAIQRDLRFKHVTNAMRGRPDDYTE